MFRQVNNMTNNLGSCSRAIILSLSYSSFCLEPEASCFITLPQNPPQLQLCLVSVGADSCLTTLRFCRGRTPGPGFSKWLHVQEKISKCCLISDNAPSPPLYLTVAHHWCQQIFMANIYFATVKTRLHVSNTEMTRKSLSSLYVKCLHYLFILEDQFSHRSNLH